MNAGCRRRKLGTSPTELGFLFLLLKEESGVWKKRAAGSADSNPLRPGNTIGDHAGLQPRGSRVLRARDCRGSGQLPGAVAELRRARPPGLPPGEAPDVPHRHAHLAGLRARLGERRGRRARAGGSLRGNDPQPLLLAHRCALQRAVPGKGGRQGAEGAWDPGGGAGQASVR